MNMNPIKEWAKFLKFIRKNHNLTEDWTPDYYSIRLYLEYLEYRRKK